MTTYYESVTSPPGGTWISATQVDFGARPGQPAVVANILPDGVRRTMSATVHWDAANGVADLGYDEAASAAGNSKFIFFYAVPTTGADSLLTIIASDNDPSVGPAGRTTFQHVWTTYKDSSGNLLAVAQRSNVFSFIRARQALALSAATADAVGVLSLTAFIPTTAAAVELLLYYQSKGTRGKLLVWVNGEAGAGDIGDPSNENNTTWISFPASAANDFGTDSQHTLVPIRGGSLAVQYQPKSGCNVALVHVCGWVDASVPAN